MNRFAVIGYPVKHSVSPAMHQAALTAQGLDAEYLRVEVAPQDLPAFVDDMRAGEWVGVNVTVPHKEAILPLLDDLAPEAAAIGAVNTVTRDGERLVGHNTDSQGFLRSLREDGRLDPGGALVALLGAGGAARGVLWALCQARARRVRVFNRTPERAEKLASAATAWGEWTEVETDVWRDGQEEWQAALDDCDLVVNATSVGLAKVEAPLPAASIRDDALVVDLVYNPRPTRLLAEAQARGLRILDGLPMLVYQGAAAFELWTGMDAPVGIMLAAAEGQLGAGETHPGLGSLLLNRQPSGGLPRQGRARRSYLRPGKHRE